MSDEDVESGDSAELPPWEQPGAVRRDCVPHRAETLYWLSCFGLVFGLVAIAGLLFRHASIAVFIPGIIALPVAAVVYLLGSQDLTEMRAGRMDPEGEGKTKTAMDYAGASAFLSVFAIFAKTIV